MTQALKELFGQRFVGNNGLVVDLLLPDDGEGIHESYNPHEPRDKKGEWTSGGTATKSKPSKNKKPVAKDTYAPSGGLTMIGGKTHDAGSNQSDSEVQKKWNAHYKNNLDLGKSIKKVSKWVKDKAVLAHFDKTCDETRKDMPLGIALERYQGSSKYLDLNAALRSGGKLDATLSEIRKRLVKAIDAAGDFPKPIQTFRGASLSTEHLNALLKVAEKSEKTGKPMTDKGFVSQSLDPEWADRFANGFAGSTDEDHHPVMFKMVSKRGLYGNTDQAEIIQKPGTKYKVKSIVRGGMPEPSARDKDYYQYHVGPNRKSFETPKGDTLKDLMAMEKKFGKEALLSSSQPAKKKTSVVTIIVMEEV